MKSAIKTAKISVWEFSHFCHRINGRHVSAGEDVPTPAFVSQLSLIFEDGHNQSPSLVLSVTSISYPCSCSYSSPSQQPGLLTHGVAFLAAPFSWETALRLLLLLLLLLLALLLLLLLNSILSFPMCVRKGEFSLFLNVLRVFALWFAKQNTDRLYALYTYEHY